jgi:hypothetical protein
MNKGALPSCRDTNAIALLRSGRRKTCDVLLRRARAPPRRSKQVGWQERGIGAVE